MCYNEDIEAALQSRSIQGSAIRPMQPVWRSIAWHNMDKLTKAQYRKCVATRACRWQAGTSHSTTSIILSGASQRELQ